VLRAAGGVIVAGKVFNVLFLCTHNSARSIMAEAILNNPAISRGRFKAYSAGSHPSGNPNPFALAQIGSVGLPLDGLRSKAWDEFAQPGAPKMDFVFTVCDNAANEVCPVWPGQPMTAHWGLPDPAAVGGSDEQKRRAFAEAFRHLAHRINIFTCLPLDKLDRLSLQQKLKEIGKTGSEAPQA
jgi:arsenate reductase